MQASRAITTFLQERGVSSSQRFALMQLTTRLAQRIGRACHAKRIFLAPDRIHAVANQTVETALREQKLNPQELGGLVHQALSELSDSVSLEMVQGTDVLPHLHDWGAIEGFVDIDLVAEAERLEGQHETTRAAAFCREVVTRYEERSEGSVADYLKALRTLFRLDPANQGWHEKIKAEEARIEAAIGRSAVAVTLTPEAQQPLWDQVKATVEATLHRGNPPRELFSVFAHLATQEDLGTIRQLLETNFSPDLAVLPSRNLVELADKFLELAKTDDIADALKMLEGGTAEKRRAFAIYIAHRLNRRETIPRLVEIFREGKIVGGRAHAALLHMLGQEDLDLLFELAQDQESHVRIFAHERLNDVTEKSDIHALRRQLKGADDNTARLVLSLIVEHGDHRDVSRAEKLLFGDAAVAIAAAWVIHKYARVEDEPLLMQMASHKTSEVRTQAFSALSFLGLPAMVPVGICLLEGSLTEQDRGYIEETLSREAPESSLPLFSASLSANVREAGRKMRLARRPKATPTLEESYVMLWSNRDIGQVDRFVRGVTKEDVTTDRFNLRRMLFDPCLRVVGAAFQAIDRLRPADCFRTLVDSYEATVKNFSAQTQRQIAAPEVILDIATEEDVETVASMLDSELLPVRILGARLVGKLRAWHLIPKVKENVLPNSWETKLTLLEFAEEFHDWQTILTYTVDEKDIIRRKSRECLTVIVTAERLPELRGMLEDGHASMRIAGAAGILALLEAKPPQTDKAEGAESTPASERPTLGNNPYSPPTTLPAVLDGARTLLDSPRGTVRYAALLVADSAEMTIPPAKIRSILAEKPNNYTLEVVFRIIAKSGYRQLIPDMEAAFPGSGPRSRIDFFAIIAQLYSAEDLPMLRRQANSRHWKKRGIALAALHRLGDRRDLVRFNRTLSLAQELKLPEEVVELATNGIRKFASARHLPQIRERIFSSPSGHAYAEVFTWLATGDIEDLAVIKHLQAHQDQRYVECGKRAAERLERPATKQPPAEKPAEDETPSEMIAEVLAKTILAKEIDDDEIDHLLRLLDTQDPQATLDVARQHLAATVNRSGYFVLPPIKTDGWSSLDLGNVVRFLETIGEYGGQEDFSMLFTQLTHADPRISGEAGATLANLIYEMQRSDAKS